MLAAASRAARLGCRRGGLAAEAVSAGRAAFSASAGEASSSKPSPTAADAGAYANARKAHKEQMSALRKQWATELLQREQADTAAAEAERLALAQQADEERARFRAEKMTRMAAHAGRAAEARRLRATERAARSERQLLREDVLAFSREERRKALLAESRAWITAETLDARIAEALDSPSALPGAVSAPRPSGQQQSAAE